jgi:hypothetical protein
MVGTPGAEVNREHRKEDAMQLSTLQDLYAHDGPFVTVHVDVSRNTEDAARQLRTRWTTIRQDLEQQSVAPELVEEIGERLLDPVSSPGEVRRTIVAAAGEILFDEAVSGHAPWPESVVVGDLPDLSGWLRHADGQFPFLLVVADREGADIDFFSSLTSATATLHSEVDGESDHLHKIRGGGWKHKRIQQRAENQWESNAREVAEEVRSLTVRNRPRVVLLAGDERARVAITESLDGLPSELVHLPSGGRAAGSSTEALWHDVRMTLARIEADDQRELSSQLEAKWRQGNGAALGVDDVLHALTQHQVEKLVLDLGKAQEITVDPARWSGLPLPEQARLDRALPAAQVLVAAGAATDATITVLPEAQGKGGGVAAVLRWDG